MNVSVVSFAAPVNVVKIAKEYHQKTIELVKSSEGNVSVTDHFVLNDDENAVAIDSIKRFRPDLIVLELGTFAQGSLIMEFLMSFVNIPLFVRGYNDPIVESHPTIPLNSLTGFIMTTSYLKRIGKRFSWSYADIDDPTADQKLTSCLKAIRLSGKMKKKKYAVVGSRVPGFYLCMVDELKFRKVIGPQIEYVSLATILSEAEKLGNPRVSDKIEELYSTVEVKVKRSQIEKTVRLYLALSDYVAANKIDALTMKCWPELQSLYGCAGCAVLSLLNNDGILACCEGDVAGLCSMDILHELSGKPIFFADLVGKSKSGALKAWHCGFGPHGLCKDGCGIAYTEQATMRSGYGTGVQFEMKTGRATICKLSEQEDGYKLFTSCGEVVDPDRRVMGVQADLLLDSGFDHTLDTLVENGFEQHYALVHDEFTDVLNEYAKWSEIKVLS